MKRLLLLFILSPVMLFGQTRRTAIVDSIKAAATNLHDVSAVINNYPDTKVEHIQVSDSGEYVTMVVRVHVTEAGVITSLPSLPVVNIKTGDIVAAGVGIVTIPPLPPPVIEAYIIESLTPLAAAKSKTGDIPFVKISTVAIPSLPDIKPRLIEALPVVAVTQLRIAGIPAGKMDPATVPPLPDIRPKLIDAFPLAVAQLKIDIVAHKADTVSVPTLADIELETMEALPPLAAVMLAVGNRSAGKIDTVTVPVFEEKKMPVTEMHLSDEGYSLLEKMEGFSPELYSLNDGGFTIGFGFFVPYGEGSKWDKGVTWEDAENMIRQKVPVYEDQVKQYVNVLLTQEEFDALTMMAYNLGGFSKATSIVNDINSNADFEQLQKDWMRFVHSKAPGVMKGLMNRRKDEMQVRNESDYQPGRKIQILKYKK